MVAFVVALEADLRVALEADLGVALELTPVLTRELVLEKAVVLLVDAYFQFHYLMTLEALEVSLVALL